MNLTITPNLTTNYKANSNSAQAVRNQYQCNPSQSKNVSFGWDVECATKEQSKLLDVLSAGLKRLFPDTQKVGGTTFERNGSTMSYTIAPSQLFNGNKIRAIAQTDGALGIAMLDKNGYKLVPTKGASLNWTDHMIYSTSDVSADELTQYLKALTSGMEKK